MLPWPDETAAPGAGFYMTNPFEGDPASDAEGGTPCEAIVYDGSSVVMPWSAGSFGRERMCREGQPLNAAGIIVRFAARRVRNRLEARLPCDGWSTIGTFGRHDTLRLVTLSWRYHRVSRALVPVCLARERLRCRPVYAPGMETQPRQLDPTLDDPYPALCGILGSPVFRAYPRAGFYWNDPFAASRSGAVVHQHLVFDGQTVVMRYSSDRFPRRRACSEPRLPDGIHRFDARVVGDELEARLPCAGWTRVARFERNAVLLGGSPEPLSKISPWRIPRCLSDEWVACRPIVPPR